MADELNFDELERLKAEAESRLNAGEPSWRRYEFDYANALGNAAPALIAAARERDELRKVLQLARGKVKHARERMLANNPSPLTGSTALAKARGLAKAREEKA